MWLALIRNPRLSMLPSSVKACGEKEKLNEAQTKAKRAPPKLLGCDTWRCLLCRHAMVKTQLQTLERTSGLNHPGFMSANKQKSQTL